MNRVLLAASLIALSWSFTGCAARDDESGTPASSANASTATGSTALKSQRTAEILLFNGTGSSPNDDTAYAWTLIHAALNRDPLPHY
jgi:hypothetical protein